MAGTTGVCHFAEMIGYRGAGSGLSAPEPSDAQVENLPHKSLDASQCPQCTCSHDCRHRNYWSPHCSSMVTVTFDLRAHYYEVGSMWKMHRDQEHRPPLFFLPILP